MNWEKFFQVRAELGRPLVMAHRGASAILPENSFSAFRQAIDDGADLIETDLHLTRDDEIVLIHDSTLDRTVNAQGSVRDYTLAELQQFTLKQLPDRQDNIERIPTLRELLVLTGKNVPLALELKSPLFKQPNYAKILVDILVEHGVVEESAIIGFDQDQLLTVKQLAPTLAAGWITLTNPFPRQPVELLGPFWPLVLVNPFYVWQAHKLGKIVAPLDSNPESRVWLYLKLGADVLLSDNPAKTLAAIERARKR
jgi:glycerophosphoryl diester phosphodiesterase